jgi:shikimate dehydrogenase
VMINRTPSKAVVIRDILLSAGHLGPSLQPFSATEGFDIVINATSASLAGACPAIPARAFEGCLLAYDLAYAKGLTPFLSRAQEAGVPQLADGVGMLVEQAAAAFEWWRGKRPSTAELIEQLAVPLRVPPAQDS